MQDPDGGDTTRTATGTRGLCRPRIRRRTRAVAVSTIGATHHRIANAEPGDVITLANGTYNGSIAISRSGTEANPIFIRGASRDGMILNAAGATAGVNITGSYITIENLTIRSSSWGMRLNSDSTPRATRGAPGEVSRTSRMAWTARCGTKWDYYICDNLLEGREAQWPDHRSVRVGFRRHRRRRRMATSSVTTRSSGFGDAFGLHHDTAIPNRAIDFYGNEILWTGDNGIELDFTERNVRAIRNRFSNGGNHSMSFQPICGGPAYAIRNVIYNSKGAPYKFNNEPSGIYLLHNTACGRARVGATGLHGDQLRYPQQHLHRHTAAGEHNDGHQPRRHRLQRLAVRTVNSASRPELDNFADLQANRRTSTTAACFPACPSQRSVTIPASPTTLISPLDARLSAGTNAVDAGAPLPNINDG